MKDTGLVAKRYAEALFNLCLKENCLEQVEKSFDSFVNDVSRNPKFVAFMESPVIPQKKKEELLAQIIPQNLPPLLTLFLRLILAKKRFESLRAIEDAFQTRSERYRGICKAELVSAVAMESATQKRLVAILEKKLSAPSISSSASSAQPTSVKLITKTDPTLIGGFVLKMDERVIDASYRTKLREMKQQLYAAAL